MESNEARSEQTFTQRKLNSFTCAMGQISAIHLHLNDKRHCSEDSRVAMWAGVTIHTGCSKVWEAVGSKKDKLFNLGN